MMKPIDLRHTLQLAALILMLAVLGGCGFHLRGALALPSSIQPIHITGHNPNGELARELRNTLHRADIAVTGDPAQGQYQLVLLSHEQQRRTLSIGAGAESAEYNLIERASFEVRNNAGERVLGPRDVQEKRVLLNDPNNRTSKDREERILHREIVQSLAHKIAAQLRPLAHSAAPTNGD